MAIARHRRIALRYRVDCICQLVVGVSVACTRTLAREQNLADDALLSLYGRQCVARRCDKSCRCGLFPLHAETVYLRRVDVCRQRQLGTTRIEILGRKPAVALHRHRFDCAIGMGRQTQSTTRTVFCKPNRILCGRSGCTDIGDTVVDSRHSRRMYAHDATACHGQCHPLCLRQRQGEHDSLQPLLHHSHGGQEQPYQIRAIFR